MLEIPFNGLVFSVVRSASDLLRQSLSNQAHIGPIRSVPPRMLSNSDLSRKTSWADGIKGWHHLINVSRQEKDENSLLEALNEYLADTQNLSMGYKVRIVDNKLLEEGGDLMRNLRGLRDVGADSKSGESVISDLNQGLDELPKQALIKLQDVGSDIEVDVQDVGAGVAQVVPIIIAALNSGISLVSVEQPELHIHPDAQSRLADLFIEQSQEDRIFILESHSEHMLLRIQRRIREQQYAPDNVALLFVSRGLGIDSPSTVERLEIDADGEMLDDWPPGFFEARYKDIFDGK